MDTINMINVGGIDKEIEDSVARSKNDSAESRINIIEADVAGLHTQVNEIIAPTGEAPNPNEIVDARIGFNGTVYDSLGLAIRTQVGKINSDLETNVGHSESVTADPIGTEEGTSIEVPITINPSELFSIKVDFESSQNRYYNLWAYYNNEWHQIDVGGINLSTNKEYRFTYNEAYRSTSIRALFFAGDAQKATCKVTVIGEVYKEIDDVNGRCSEIEEHVNEIGGYINTNVGHSESVVADPLGALQGATIDVPIKVNSYEEISIKVKFESGTNREYILWAYYDNDWHQIYIGNSNLITNKEYKLTYTEPTSCSMIRAMFYAGDSKKASCTIAVLGKVSKETENVDEHVFGTTKSVVKNELEPQQGSSIRVPITVQPGQTLKLKVEFDGQENRGCNVWAYYNGSEHLITDTLVTNRDYEMVYNEKEPCEFITFLFYAGESVRAKAIVTTVGEVYKDRTNVVRVGKDKEFTSIQDALDNISDSESNPVVIYIDPGIYEPFDDKNLRNVSLIGSGKETTIVRSTSGHYDYPGANFRTNGLIFGIGFEMRATEPNQKPGTPYAYAFHSDWGTCKMEIVDCSFYSNAGPAIGLGLHDHERLMFKNCDFITEVDGTFGSNLGAFFCHSSFTPESVEQYLEVRNCIAENRKMTNGFNIGVLDDVPGCTYEAVMIGNGTYDINGNGGHIDAAFLSNKSFGNNNSSFNAS